MSLVDYFLSLQKILAWKRKNLIVLLFVWALTFESVGAFESVGSFKSVSARAEDQVLGINHGSQDTLHLRSDKLKLVVANNEAYGEHHLAGYSGISELYLKGSDRNFFREASSGLNFEFISSGDSTSYDWNRFEPRRAPMELVRLGSDKVQLRQSRTENWPLQSHITYELSGNMVEMTYEGVSLEDVWSKHGYIGLFFASYINEPEEKGIHFIGKHRSEDASKARWIYHLPSEHGREANHRPMESDWDPPFDDGFPLSLVSGFSDLEYAYPFYYGRSGDDVLIMMFDRLDDDSEMRFAQSPDALSAPYTNPAWDFLYFNKNPVSGEKFHFRVGMVIKKFEGVDDVIEQYESWSGETVTVFEQTEEEKRQGYLDEMLKLFRPHPDPQERPRNVFAGFERLGYHDHTWYDWLERTGELPPDFDAMPSIPFLPDPFTIDEGGENIPVKTLSQWDEKRSEIKQHVKHWFTGSYPPPPDDLKIEVLEERVENGVIIEKVELRFGRNEKAKLTLEVMTPPGDGPFPVFMTQWNHRGWAQIAVRRGYIGLLYAGADTKDDTKSYQELYPDYDWSIFMTRAWGAHRAVDYLYTLDSVDKSKIAITGHSRNAMMSLIAAALDERITATISSSGGTGGETPYRYSDERYEYESIDLLLSIRPQWFHPRLRFFGGREHKLPIDQNSLMALIAPNALLLSTSIREGGANHWGIEENYRALTGVYEFLEVPDRLGILSRDGGHGVEARDLERYMDWLDIQFDRKTMPWENTLFYDYSFEKWKAISGEEVDPGDFPVVPEKEPVLADSRGDVIEIPEQWIQKRREIKKKINWVLGDEPAGVSAHPIESLSSRQDYIDSFLNRPRVSNGRVEYIAPYNALGDYLHGALYYPTDENGERITRENGKLPVVIFLHKYSNIGHGSLDRFLFEDILSRGMAVLAMDLIGYGTRIEEGTNFYERYPHWSKLGKMVTDTRAAVDALESIDFVDNDRIYLTGYALGGTVGLFTAALDQRIAGTAVSGAFTPLRTASDDVEGVKAYSHLHGLLPRLGFFANSEERIPVDFTEIIATIAPRPLLMIAPELDRHADSVQVGRSLREAGSVYDLLNKSENLHISTPRQFDRFTSAQRDEVVNWLEKMADQ